MLFGCGGVLAALHVWSVWPLRCRDLFDGCAGYLPTGAVRQAGLLADIDLSTKQTYSEMNDAHKRMVDQLAAAELKPLRLNRAAQSALADAKAQAAAALNATKEAGEGDSHKDSDDEPPRPDQSDEPLKRKLDELKRDLQRIEAACAGRLIDSIVFAPDRDPPFEVDVSVALKNVGYRISVPYDPKYFRYYLLHPRTLTSVA